MTEYKCPSELELEAQLDYQDWVSSHFDNMSDDERGGIMGK